MFLRRLVHFVRAIVAVLWRRTPTFSEVAAEVLEQKKLRAKGTYELAKIVLGRLVAHFGAMRVADVSETHWREYIALRRLARPGCKFFDDKKYLTQVMLTSFRRGFIRRKLEIWIPDLPTSAGREITTPELRRLWKHAAPELRFQIEVAYKMGLRLRELLSLRWDRFDWERRTILLFAAETKTRRGREVPINPDLFQRFRKRRVRSSSLFVFPSRNDPTRPQHDNKTAWRRCRRKAGVGARWHDLRHSCATVMLRRGATIPATRRILGMGEKVLLEIYQHLNVRDLHRASAVMSDRNRARSRSRS